VLKALLRTPLGSTLLCKWILLNRSLQLLMINTVKFLGFLKKNNTPRYSTFYILLIAWPITMKTLYYWLEQKTFLSILSTLLIKLLLKKIIAHLDSINSIFNLWNGKFVVTVGIDSHIKIWRIAQIKKKIIKLLQISTGTKICLLLTLTNNLKNYIEMH
jgi:WD40 repeat protein